MQFYATQLAVKLNIDFIDFDTGLGLRFKINVVWEESNGFRTKNNGEPPVAASWPWQQQRQVLQRPEDSPRRTWQMSFFMSF